MKEQTKTIFSKFWYDENESYTIGDTLKFFGFLYLVFLFGWFCLAAKTGYLFTNFVGLIKLSFGYSLFVLFGIIINCR